MVFLIAKNFQLVKFSQANFGIKNPPANVQRGWSLATVYRLGLVRLCKGIAVKMAATPSLNCVLSIKCR